MKIITAPHPTLRQAAQPVIKVTPQVIAFVDQLEQTLKRKQNPQGVGLAAPQVNFAWRVFVTQLPENNDPHDENIPSRLQSYINPQIIQHSTDQILGPTNDDITYEGCLSIPGLYGPVPRWSWVHVAYQVLQEGRLVATEEKLTGFNARVFQHELDHLEGVLFTDYTLEYDLPIYQENTRTNRLVELTNRSILEVL